MLKSLIKVFLARKTKAAASEKHIKNRIWGTKTDPRKWLSFNLIRPKTKEQTQMQSVSWLCRTVVRNYRNTRWHHPHKQTQLGALAEYMVRICETGSGYTKSFFGVAVKYVYWNCIINSCYFCLGGICKFTKEQKGTLSWLLSTDRQRKDIIYLSMWKGRYIY